MQMISSPLHWGNTTLVLDRRAFEQGYVHGRQYYFQDEEERDEAHSVLTATSLLRLIAIPDERGCYQLDDGWDYSAFPSGVEELLGVLVGYLSGPLHPEAFEKCANREHDVLLIKQEG